MLIIEIIGVLVLIALNGVLAGSEMAIVSSRKGRLENLAGESRGARAALGLVEDPGTFLSTVQIGITLVGIIAGAYSGAALAAPLGAWLDGFALIAPNGSVVAIIVVVVLVTYLSLIVGELVPKRIALANPERIAALVARPMQVLALIAAPAVWLLRHSSDGALKALGLTGARDATVTEEEVKSLIAEGTRSGVFQPQEREMIVGVLRLADRSVRAIMTPRAEVAWIAVDAAPEEVLNRVKGERHTQLLVCEGSIDSPIGLIDASDVIRARLDRGTVDLAAIVRNVPIIPEQTTALRLLELFRNGGEHFAVIVDEYGTTQGIVTATDVLESIAGELPGRGEAADAMIVARDDGSWLVDGLLPIDEFEDLVGRKGLRAGADFVTLAGFILERLGHLPQAGDKVTDGDLTIEVVVMDVRRIDKVLVTTDNPTGSLAGK
jgi:putative hemolysin